MIEQSREKFAEHPKCKWVLADAQTYHRDGPIRSLHRALRALVIRPIGYLEKYLCASSTGGLFVLGIIVAPFGNSELRLAIAPGKGGPALPLDELVQQHILASGFTLEAHTTERDTSMRMVALF